MIETPGRNSPCPCGSGRKYKQCCLGRESELAARRHELALAHLEEGRAEVAVAALKESLALDGKQSRVHSVLGVALRRV